MKIKAILGTLAATAVFGSFAADSAKACTNVIVTKGASADGSCMISYAADSHWLYGELYFKPQADWKEGISFAYLIGIQDNTSGSLTRSSILIRLSET